MDIGLNMSISTNSIDVAEIAAKAEALGFESIWLPEHPVMPVNTASKYPGSPDGSIPDYMSDMADPYIGLARASAVTSTIKLGTGITLIPERNPLVLAGAIASLDRFSGGRFLLGIGTGWLREETEIMGGDFDHRWTQARESIEVMRALWTQDAAEYHGCYYDFPPVQCNPKPAQEGGPPVILGGNARNVFRRVARWGDGWMPTASSPEQIAAGRAAIDELAEASGRDPSGIGITVFGQPADRGLISQFESAGANRVIVRLGDTTSPQALEEIERIAQAVL
ncbi:MAG: LLM class F420-dependent oxidoreductase [Chloroflexota bacterium]|nr:LLM class F420-dependent oxidoreductase [Chloroflexota bacterium]MDE2683413.1 LLM class F420-dependent oxidoreductase [Chloroflexota bacterium]